MRLAITVMHHFLKETARTLRQRLSAAVQPSIKVKLTRRNLFILLPRNCGNRRGGEFYMLPHPGKMELTKFAIAAENGGYTVYMRLADQRIPLAQFPAATGAHIALAKINKALTGNRMVKWCGRVVLLWLGWLLITSYWQINQPTHTLAPNEPAAFSPSPPGTGSPALPPAATVHESADKAGCDPKLAFKVPPQ